MVIKWCVWQCQVKCHTVTFNLLNRFYSVLNEVFALERLQCIPIHPHPCLHRKRWQRFWELPTFTLRKESPWTSRVWSGWAILSIMLVVFMVRLDHFIEVITFRSGTAQNHHSSYSGSTMTRSPLEFYCLRSCSSFYAHDALIWCTYIYIWNPGNLLRLSPRRGFPNHREGWDDSFLPSDPGERLSHWELRFPIWQIPIDPDQRARVSDSGAYLCQPSVGGPAGAMVHVIRGWQCHFISIAIQVATKQSTNEVHIRSMS